MKKAIIIGAGPAGLTAAYQLLKETDIHPILFEKSSMIGGISQTAIYKENHIDLGGHRFFTKNPDVMSLWQELMPLQGAPSKDDLLLNRIREFPGKADPEIEDDVLLIRNRVSRIYYLAHFFDYPISMKLRTFANMGPWRTIKAGFGYMYSAVFKRQEHSLEDFYINRFGKPLYQMFFEDYTEKLWGKHPRYISAEWGAQRVKGLSLSKAILSAIAKPFKKKSDKVETSLIEEFYYPKKGPGQLYEKMADKIKELGGEIHMNADVQSIYMENNHIESIEVLENGSINSYNADYYLSSMAIKDLVSRSTNTSEEVKEVATNLPYRDFITVGLLLKDVKLKNKTKIKTYNDVLPDCWIYIQERNVKVGRIQIFNNWSPYMVKDFENTIWIGLEYFCSEGDTLWNMPDQEFIDFAINEMVTIGVIDKANVLDAFRLKVEKAYPAYFDAYEQFPMVKEYLQNIDNLYCIGRNGQHRYNNMDHSMLTAMEAVDSIIDPSRDRRLLWEVNAEKEYHEEAKK
jgi:protoporphyrinogen oxidase